MARLLIIYHSLTGGTVQMAAAALQGAQQAADIEVAMQTAAESEASDLLEADGYIFAAPENLAAIAGVMKAFFDRSYYPLLGKIEGRPYAAMICAGSDGENARQQLERIATGWRLKKVMETPIVCTHAQTPEEILGEKQIAGDDLARCRELGSTLAAGLEIGVF